MHPLSTISIPGRGERTCYFLLNYAFGEHLECLEEDFACYFLLNYASAIEQKLAALEARMDLLFSFELCQYEEKRRAAMEPLLERLGLLFSFELCAYKSFIKKPLEALEDLLFSFELCHGVRDVGQYHGPQ